MKQEYRVQVKSTIYSLYNIAMVYSVLLGVCFVAWLLSISSSPLCVWCVVALGAISTIRLDQPENDISAITLTLAAQY